MSERGGPDWPPKDLSPYWQRRVLGAAVLVGALAVLVWQAYTLPMPEAGEYEVAVPPPRVATPMAGTRLRGAAPPVRAPEPAKTPLAEDEFEVCGLGRVKAARLDDPKLVRLPARQAIARAAEALARSPDEVSKATGLALQSSDLATSDDAPRNVAAQAGESRQALARMAVGTRSARVYALAVQACLQHPGEGSCRLLSADQWARLEPGNLVPWLQVMQEAAQRGDVAAQNEALYRMTLAQRSDMRFGQVAAAAADRLPADLAPPVRLGALNVLFGEASKSLPMYQGIVQACASDQVRDANRQQVCAQIAELLVTRGSARVDLSIGLGVGERAGWPAARVAALREERDALIWVETVQAEPGDAWSCVAVERMAQRIADIGLYGELAALRRAQRQTGLTLAELAQLQRQLSAAEVAAAASGASGAAASR